jgi:3-phosphoshikimate 1-carboxyvinyltransferase
LQPLDSKDPEASVIGCRAFGAKIKKQKSLWEIEGFGGKPKTPKQKTIDLLNSGTSMNMIAGVAGHAKGPVELTGDESLRSRPFEPIVKALNDLGAKAIAKGKGGKPPLEIRGFLKGGCTEIYGLSSQPVSSLLINCAIAPEATEIKVSNPHETPYIEMTMRWLREQSISFKAKGFTEYFVEGSQKYNSFSKEIPADFSSATFPLCAAAICGNSEVLLEGLDFEDAQGDKEVFKMLQRMGCQMDFEDTGVRVFASELKGRELDLNDTPDALPMLSVVGCFAEGETRLVNVANARIKETDRIAAMREELQKMGASVEEFKDGLVVRKSSLQGALVDGRQDHRIVMALAVAGLAAEGTTTVSTAEAINVTYPSFIDSMRAAGARICLAESGAGK